MDVEEYIPPMSKMRLDQAGLNIPNQILPASFPTARKRKAEEADMEFEDNFMRPKNRVFFQNNQLSLTREVLNQGSFIHYFHEFHGIFILQATNQDLTSFFEMLSEKFYGDELAFQLFAISEVYNVEALFHSLSRECPHRLHAVLKRALNHDNHHTLVSIVLRCSSCKKIKVETMDIFAATEKTFLPEIYTHLFEHLEVPIHSSFVRRWIYHGFVNEHLLYNTINVIVIDDFTLIAAMESTWCRGIVDAMVDRMSTCSTSVVVQAIRREFPQPTINRLMEICDTPQFINTFRL